MGYTDLTSLFVYKDPVFWSRQDALAENDLWLKTNRSFYKRPVLQTYAGDASIFVAESNVATAYTTAILFPDGDLRTVTEDPVVNNTTRVCNVHVTANFTSGVLAGLKPGLTLTLRTWYAVYAVKSQVDSVNFVLILDTILPIQTNAATLNAYYGTNSWVYLGLIRIYDAGGGLKLPMPFTQVGNRTLFRVNESGITSRIGAEYPFGSLATSYLYAKGTGPLQIPDNIGSIIYAGYISASANNVLIEDYYGNVCYKTVASDRNTAFQVEIPAEYGISYVPDSGAIVSSYIGVAGWVDKVLGVGNPLL